MHLSWGERSQGWGSEYSYPWRAPIVCPRADDWEPGPGSQKPLALTKKGWGGEGWETHLTRVPLLLAGRRKNPR
jgi:hypothetical protein